MTGTGRRRFPVLIAAIAALAVAMALLFPVQAQEGSAPDKPRGLSATASHDRVVLTWDDPGDDSITGYMILRRNRQIDRKGEFRELVPDTGTAATTYTDDRVAAGTPYTYRIKAINKHGVSERSRWFHVDIPAAPVPVKPTGLSATASHDQVVLTWDDPGDDTITGYVILRRLRENDVGGEFSELVPDTGTAATTYTDATVKANTTCTYRIKAINEHGVSERSRWFHIDIPASPEAVEGDDPDEQGGEDEDGAPGHGTPSGPGGTVKLVELRQVPLGPQGFEASNGNEQVTLTWDAPAADADITRHEYRFKTTGDYPAEWTEIDDSAPGGAHEDWVVVTNLTNDTAYTFQLRAGNADGASSAAEAGPVTPRSGVCGRTEWVREVIVLSVGFSDADVSDCADVTTTHLAALTALPYFLDRGIRSLQPDDFSGLTALTELNLGRNDLSELPAGMFSDLTALQILYLSYNDLSELPDDVFSGLTALQKLSLQDNEFSELPDDVFSELTALQELYLGINEFSSLPDDMFSELTALETLWLQDNEFSSLPDDVFSGLTALESLRLHKNKFSSLPDDVFSDLTALKELYLYKNEFSELPAGVFSGLTALERLRLYSNKFSELPAGVFSDLTALEVLYLHNNEFSELPDGVFSGLTALEVLALSDNEFSELPDDVFSDLTALTLLWLQDNEFSSLPDDVFSDLTALEHLRLHTNKFSSLPDDVFSGLTALKELYLYNNEFSSLPAGVFSGLTALKELYLHNNEFSELPDGVFSGLTALKVLALSDNQFSSLSDDVFSDLRKLGKLYLHNNEFSELPDGVFSGLTALETLWLREKPEEDDAEDDAEDPLQDKEDEEDEEDEEEDPLPLTVTLERVGSDQVRAKVLAGAPFAVEIPVTVANGELDDGATALSVAAGSVEGTAVTVIRTAGTTAAMSAAVTADIDLTTQPTLPDDHYGYTFVKSTSDLPLTVVQGQGFREGATTDLPADATTSGVLVVDGFAARATISDYRDRDWFAVELKAGRTYRIDMKGAILVAPGTLADPELSLYLPEIGALYDADSNYLHNTSSRGHTGPHHLARVEFTPHADGAYYISATGVSFETGGYELRLIDITQDDDEHTANRNTAGTVDVGGSATGKIDFSGDRDWFAVELEAGQAYRFDLEGEDTGRGSLRDPDLRGIFDAAGNEISGTRNDDGGEGNNARVTFTPSVAGTYYIAAGAVGYYEGTYTLSVTGPASKPALADGPPGLAPNVPNPFNANTLIPYRLDTDGSVRLEIYNLLGQSIRTLVDEVQAAGAYRVRWDARDAAGRRVSTGIYFTRLHYPGGVQTRRMLYLE